MAEKMIKNIGKSGQVTIFIILAMILIVGIIILFVIFREPSIESQISYEKNPEQYIGLAVKDSVKEGVEILSKQGGYIEPMNYRLYDGENIGYLCYNRNYYYPCINQEPLLIEHLEQEIKDYISPEVENSFQSLKASLEKKNYEVELKGDTSINVNLILGQIITNIEKNLTITKGGNSQNFKNFKIILAHPLYDLGKIAIEIVNQESLFCDYGYVNFMMLHPEYHITRIQLGSTENREEDSVNIYTLKEKKSGKEFKFAVKSCTIPPGLSSGL